MAGTAVHRRLIWRLATVVANAPVSDTASRLTVDIPQWAGHVAGQHIDVRLTAADGYEAQRSYSIASAPEQQRVDLVVQRVAEGEVSPYLVDELGHGDQLELRGPIGGHFVWRSDFGGPVQLIAGGSGIAPFLAMLGHHAEVHSTVPVRLLYSARTSAAIIDARALDAHAGRGVGVTITLTREAHVTGATRRGRVGALLLEEIVWPPAERPQVFVCGPTAFVESVADALIMLGHAATSIKTERFG